MKSREDEVFHVGDEVQHIDEDGRIMETRFVITSISYDGSLNGIGKYGIAICDKNPARWHKTGRHFDEAEKLMKALNGNHESDLISRHDALDALVEKGQQSRRYKLGETWELNFEEIREALETVPPKPAIPLQWIETQIEWLKSLNDAFSTLYSVQISAMVNRWKDEQDGRPSQ